MTQPLYVAGLGPRPFMWWVPDHNPLCGVSGIGRMAGRLATHPTQTASRLVQPFLQGLLLRQAVRQTMLLGLQQ